MMRKKKLAMGVKTVKVRKQTSNWLMRLVWFTEAVPSSNYGPDILETSLASSTVVCPKGASGSRGMETHSLFVAGSRRLYWSSCLA